MPLFSAQRFVHMPMKLHILPNLGDFDELAQARWRLLIQADCEIQMPRPLGSTNLAGVILTNSR